MITSQQGWPKVSNQEPKSIGIQLTGNCSDPTLKPKSIEIQLTGQIGRNAAVAIFHLQRLSSALTSVDNCIGRLFWWFWWWGGKFDDSDDNYDDYDEEEDDYVEFDDFCKHCIWESNRDPVAFDCVHRHNSKGRLTFWQRSEALNDAMLFSNYDQLTNSAV